MSPSLPAWPPASYEKIAETLAAWLGDDDAAFRAANRVEWIVTEKIHGANFCFVTDGQAIRCAKRKTFLADDEDFFGHRSVLERLTPNILRLFELARARQSRASLVYVYGELFGGAYPHPDVAPIPGIQAIQTGCWYAPGIQFCAFDLGILRSDESERAYLDYDEAIRLFEESGIPFVRPLFRGAYEVASAFPLGFETTIPASLGLPSLGPQNRAEGVVLKPARALVVPRREGSLRPVIKRKIAEFSEDERFHRAEKWGAAPAPAPDVPALEWLRYEVSALVNENRLHAAISKVGPVQQNDAKRLAEVLALVIDDLHTELRAHHADRLRALSQSESEMLGRFIDGEARALVELYLGLVPP